MIEMALEDPAATADHDGRRTDRRRTAEAGAKTSPVPTALEIAPFVAAARGHRGVAASLVIPFSSKLQVVTP